MLETLRKRFQEAAPKADFCTLRFVRERNEQISVRQNVLQPVTTSEDIGVMVTVYDGGGMGYAGTSDISTGGIRRAAKQAHDWAKRTAGRSVIERAQAIATPVALMLPRPAR